jgi:hypothetical protein
MPKMGVNPEQTKEQKPIPAGWYELKIKAGVCKMSKSKKGYNYEFITEVVNNQAEFNGTTVWARINNGFTQAKVANDFVHAAGFELEPDGSFPGDWKLKDPAKTDDFDGAQYSGPLLGKTVRAELAIDSYEGTDRNVVKQFQCKVAECPTKFPDIRHMTDIRGKKAA